MAAQPLSRVKQWIYFSGNLFCCMKNLAKELTNLNWNPGAWHPLGEGVREANLALRFIL